MTFPTIPRHSTTLMLAVRSQLTNQQSLPSVGYKLLMLQRSSSMKFMPNNYVFPGGVSEPTDFSPDWLDLLGNKVLPIKATMTSVPFYESYTKHLPKNSLPAHIGFRICAIRETFEESGVLLVRPLKDSNHVGSLADIGQKVLKEEELKSWRGKVHSNSSAFIQLCRHIQCVPDIWSLHEWSNWITPAYHVRRRFNTMFYLAFLNYKPEMSHDGTEVVSSTWVNPADVLDPRSKKMLSIAPPQFYEMSRLCRFSTVDELKSFALSLEGVDDAEPVSLESSDGSSIYFFPGDDMYEQVKSDAYKHYENLINTTPAEDLKSRLPQLKVPQNTDAFLVKTEGSTNRLAVNFKTGLFKMNCTAKLKYDMPTPLVPLISNL